ncbi:unnamed protein product [Pylaiella littoralis]
MGPRGDIVSTSDLVRSMAYHAAAAGYSPELEYFEKVSPTFSDIEGSPDVYRDMLRRVESYATLAGGKKVVAAKKAIRVGVSARMAEMRGRPGGPGVFAEDAADMESLFADTDHKKVICKLHRLGRYPEDNPRFYIHMVYRYYTNDAHNALADEGKVLRYPSLQKTMDVKHPVDCVGSTPPEFRMFLRESKGHPVPVASLPVPSKTRANEVVYGYDFESAVPWVPAIRAKIHNMFADLKATGSQAFRQVYPGYLLKGAGRESGNKTVLDALARSIEMGDLARALDGIVNNAVATRVLDRAILVDRGITEVVCSYNRHPFRSSGEQLRERLGFFLQDSVRGVFRSAARRIPSFCEILYTSLGIPCVTMDAFDEFCRSKNAMNYRLRDEDAWRIFIIDLQKICFIFHARSRADEVSRFMSENGSGDGYLRRVLSTLA